MQRRTIHQITGEIVTQSGLHVGGTEDELEIGGIDLPVIKTPETGIPYIPGSSLKGRMRSELERVLNKYSNNGREPCNCCKPKCPVCRVFGPHKYRAAKKQLSNGKTVDDVSNHPGPTRLLVRDAYASAAIATELKTENVIDRHTGQATPRKYERVPRGVRFAFRLTLQVMDVDDNFDFTDRSGKQTKSGEALLAVVCDCLHYVQETGVGGSLSRGSGEILFDKLKCDGVDWKCI